MRVNHRVFLGLLVAIVGFGVAYNAQADIVVDFEDPLLGFQGQRIMDPFVNQGLSFTAEPFPGAAPLDEVGGLVYNEFSNACVEPPSRDVKYGTGRELVPPNGRVGLDGYPINATLQTPLIPNASRGDQVQVSVDFQTVMGKEVRLRLYNSEDQIVVEEVGTVTRNQGDCGRLGSPRGTIRLTAVTQEEVSYMRFDIPDNILGGIAYVIDNVVVKLSLGTQVRGTPVGDLCNRLASKRSSLPFTLHTVDDCQVIDTIDDLGEGEFKAYVANMMKVQILNGRDLCNIVGGCTPCPIADFICPNLEFTFYDSEPHSLNFTTIFTLSVYDLDANLIGTGQRQRDGGIRLFFTKPTTHSSGEEGNFFVVLRPHQQGLPWKFDFWANVHLNVDNPDPLKQFDMNGNLVIDTSEFFAIMDQWADGFIPDALFFAGLDLWTSQLPISAASFASNSATTGHSSDDDEAIERLNLRQLANSMTFSAANATSLRISVYDTRGELIFAKWSQGSRLTWNMQDINGQRVANGVYFVQLTSQDAQGNVSNELKKIAILN